MITFMLGVLASVIFWAIYIPASFCIAIFMIKIIGKKRPYSRSYVLLTTGKHAYRIEIAVEGWDKYGETAAPMQGEDKPWIMAVLMLYSITWPLVLPCMISFFILKHVFNGIVYLACFMMGRMPEIEVVLKKEK
jgi:hypothetical protein